MYDRMNTIAMYSRISTIAMYNQMNNTAMYSRMNHQIYQSLLHLFMIKTEITDVSTIFFVISHDESSLTPSGYVDQKKEMLW